MLALRSWTVLVHQLRDEAGRPLGEHRALQRISTGTAESSPPVPMDLVPCPYPDSRASAGKPINASALREMIKHWRPAIALLARVRREIAVAGPMDIWWAGQVAESLPYLILFRNGGRPEDVVVPGPVAALYKAMLGTNAGILGYVLDLPPSPERVPPGVDDIVSHVEKHGLLVGPEQACAGPESLIRETLSVLIHGGPHSEEADRLFDSYPGAVALGRARASLLVARLAFGFSTHAIFADLLEELCDGPGALRDAIAQLSLNEPTADQKRFADSSHADRFERLRGLVQHADAGEEFWRSCERVLALRFAGECRPELASALARVIPARSALDALCQAIARQDLLEDACRMWISALKRRITQLLPSDPPPSGELQLTTAGLPAQTPLRRLVKILTAEQRQNEA